MASNVVEIRSSSTSYQSVAKWKVKVGATVQANSLLAQLQSGNGTTSLKSTHFGKVTKLCVIEGVKIEMGSVLCEIELCSHPIQLREMCAVCGADLRLLDTASVANLKRNNSNNSEQKQSNAIAIVHSRPDLLVDTSTGIELGRRERAELLVRRKLVLLVDLDQTLVHTTHENVPADLPGVVHYQTSGSSHLHNTHAGSSASMWYHTKIRPGTQAFLERLAQRYELHIFTMGSRAYAHAVADALDPSHKLFARRILSRDECLDAFRKTANLRALFPSGDQLVTIIDDRDEVWSFAPNLVQVRPFVTPFDHLVDEAESEADAPETVYLDRLGVILERVHSAFYEEFDNRTASTLPPPPPSDKRVDLEAQVSRVTKLQESTIPDLKLVVPSLKGAVLRGTAVVFSCVHPRNVDAQRCFTHRVATQLGASVFSDLHAALKILRRSVSRCRSSSKLAGSANEDGTTTPAAPAAAVASSSASETQDTTPEETLNEVMLVCGKYGSSKQHEAKGLHDERVHVVTVEWLYETYYFWQRQSPEAFPVPHEYDLARYCEMPEPFYIRNWQLRLERLRERRAKQEVQQSIEQEADTETKVKDDSDASVDVKVETAAAGSEPKLDATRKNEVQLASDAASNRLIANRERRRRVADTKAGPPNKRQNFESPNPLPHFSDDQLAEMEREIDEALNEDDADGEETEAPAAQRPLAPPRATPEDDALMYGENEDVPLGWTVDEFERVGRSRASRKQRWRVTVANGDELKLGDTTTEDDDPDGAVASARKRQEGRATDDELNDESRLDAGVRLLMNADNVMGDYACLTRMRSGVLENENEDEEQEQQPNDEAEACDQNACNAQLDGHFSA